MNATVKASRRSILRGMMGGAAVSVALPFLDCFLDESGTALAATGAPLPTVFGTWFWGCGLNPGRWEPATFGKGYEFGTELTPLAPYKDRINVFSGLRVFLDGKGAKPHYTGDMAILTGNVPTEGGVSSGGQAGYSSIDQIIADQIGTKTRFRSLETTGTGKPTDSLSRRASGVQNPAEISPVALYTRVFGPDFRDPNAADFKPDTKVMVRRSVLSAVTDQREALLKQVGMADRARLDEYFTSLRELEQQLDIELQKPAPLAACTAADKPDELPPGTEIDTVSHNNQLFAKILAHAIACDQTRVFNVVFGEATSPLRKAGTPMTHHILTHEEPMDASLGYQKEASSFIRSIVEGFAFMLATMDSIKEGDHTLLDRSLVMTATDTGFAKIHSLENIPIMIAGSGNGKVKTGMHFQAKGDPVTRVGLTLQQVMGVPLDNWGTLSLNTNKPFGEIIA